MSAEPGSVLPKPARKSEPRAAMPRMVAAKPWIVESAILPTNAVDLVSPISVDVLLKPAVNLAPTAALSIPDVVAPIVVPAMPRIPAVETAFPTNADAPARCPMPSPLVWEAYA